MSYFEWSSAASICAALWSAISRSGSCRPPEGRSSVVSCSGVVYVFVSEFQNLLHHLCELLRLDMRRIDAQHGVEVVQRRAPLAHAVVEFSAFEQQLHVTGMFRNPGREGCYAGCGLQSPLRM